MALISDKIDDAVRFNDLTNEYLARGDAAAQKAIVSSDTLKLLEAEKHRPAPASQGESPLEPGQDELLDGFTQAYQALVSGRLTAPIRFSLAAMGEATKAAGPADEVRAHCGANDEAGSGRELLAAMFRAQGQLDENLKISTGSGYAPISILLFRCAPVEKAGAVQGAPTPLPIPVYATMTRYKGTFEEMIAPRQMTVMPGYGQEVADSMHSITDARARAMMAFLPPGVQQTLMKLPPDARGKAFQDYTESHKNDAPDDAARVAATKAMIDMIKSMFEAGRVLNQRDKSQDDPLEFLKMLKPHEVLVDVYKYRPREEDHFGPEQYLAVIGDSSGSPRMVQLGRAQTIDSAVGSFLSGFSGAGRPSRGVKANRPAGDRQTDWKTLQQVVAQPIVAASRRARKKSC